MNLRNYQRAQVMALKEEKKMSNPISDKAKQWAGLIVSLLVVVLAIMAEWADMGQSFVLWTGRGAAMLVVVSNVLGLSIPNVKAKVAGGAAVLFLALSLMYAAGCADPYKTARGTTAGVMYAVKASSKGLASASSTEIKAGGDKTTVCKRLIAYRDNIRPAARSSIAASLAAIRIAKEAGKKDFGHLDVLKPGGCALLFGLREWGHKLSDKGAGILPYLDPFLGKLCETPKSATAAIMAVVLPIAVELVKWIVELVGKPSDSVDAEIAAWLLASPADEVDVLIKAECRGT